MRVTHILTLSILFNIMTACGDTNLPAPIVENPETAFSIPNDFVIGINQNDASQTSTLYAVQRGKDFILLREDASDSILCSNITGSGSCIARSQRIFSQDDTSTLIRVATQSVKRMLLKQITLTDTQDKISTTHPKFTLSNPEKIPTPLLPYFSEYIEKNAELCASRTKESEEEMVCYWENLMPFYQYIESSDIPVASTRALFSYKEITLSEQEFKNIYLQFKDNLSK